MKVLFDREKALRHKLEIEAEVDKENAMRQKHDRKVWIIAWLITLAIVLLSAFGGWLLFQEEFRMGFTELNLLSAGSYVFLCLLLACIPALVANESLYGSLRYDDVYTTDVKYLLETEGKSVLEHKLESESNRYPALYVVTEDGCHFVRTSCACCLRKEVSTAVEEETADLEKGLLLVPYKNESEH